jgi:hypothetical protein
LKQTHADQTPKNSGNTHSPISPITLLAFAFAASTWKSVRTGQHTRAQTAVRTLKRWTQSFALRPGTLKKKSKNHFKIKCM